MQQAKYAKLKAAQRTLATTLCEIPGLHKNRSPREEEERNKMKRLIITLRNLLLVFISAINIACVSNLQNVSLTPEEQNVNRETWETAERLVKYDYYSWIASDSLIKLRHSGDSAKYEGWVVIGDDAKKNVIFGNLSEMGLTSNFRLSFSNGKTEHINHTDTLYNAHSDAYIGFKAMTKMRTKFQVEFDTLDVPMNSYVLFNGDTIVVYFFPGSTDKYVIMGGGYRCKYMKTNLTEIESIKLHRSPIILEEPPKDVVGSMRTSSNSDLLNEVDIAQSIICKDRLPNQYIITKKYIYVFAKTKDTGDLRLQSIMKNDKRKQ